LLRRNIKSLRQDYQTILNSTEILVDTMIAALSGNPTKKQEYTTTNAVNNGHS
jgi:hypothetical protein